MITKKRKAITPLAKKFNYSELSNIAYNFDCLMDGEFVFKYQYMTNTTVIGNYRFNISNYLPEDEHSYEVLVTGIYLTQNIQSGGISVSTSASPDYDFCIGQATGNTSTSGTFRTTIPIVIDKSRELTYRLYGSQPVNAGFLLNGYRRLGKNK